MGDTGRINAKLLTTGEGCIANGTIDNQARKPTLDDSREHHLANQRIG
jgi:hypothetical protein